MGFAVGDLLDPACWSWPIPPEGVEPPDGEGFLWLASWTSYRWDLFHGGRGHLRCAICGDALQRKAFDHDHVDGLIRGYLCIGCNGREARTDAETFIRYRQRPPSLILGEWVPYNEDPPCLATLRRPGYERHLEKYGHLLGAA